MKELFFDNTEQQAMEALQGLRTYLSAIELYHQHPYRRQVTKTTILWQEGSTKLLSYGTWKSQAPAVLFIPSLINKSYILDLKKNHSMLKFLGRHKINVLLLAWGEPTEEELGFNFDDYVLKRVAPAISAIHNQQPGHKLILAGYCLGGLLALAACKFSQVNGLVLLATPWDFSYNQLDFSAVNQLVSGNKLASGLLQLLFHLNGMPKTITKFEKFMQMDQDSKEAELFVAVERWLGDGISVPMPLFKQLITDFATNNDLINGKWMIDPKEIMIPTLVVIPQNDQIVPAGSSLALAKNLPTSRVIMIDSGHVGMIIGSKAKEKLWQPLAKWIQAH